MEAVSLSFFRFEGAVNRLWAFSQMQFARAPLRAMPGIGFFKLFGTGTGEGFTPIPNFGVYAILATWPSLDEAQSAVTEGAIFHRYRAHAAESATVFLSAYASRGQWDGGSPFAVSPLEEAPVPFAVLTRATVNLRHLSAFWRHTPHVSALVRAQNHMRFKMGMGEVPWVQQVTFSIWDDPAAMQAFAYGQGPHRGAVGGVRQGHWFREELYARFRVLGWEGTWEGRAPLAGVGVDRPEITHQAALA
ncbi:MAG: spheroidene monooxygenase [Alphaproteobacteria bacterium]